MMNPFQSLADSRKFWVVSITVLGGLIIYFATKYLSPSYADDVKQVIGAIFVLVGWYVKMIKDEDVARLQNPPAVQIQSTNKSLGLVAPPFPPGFEITPNAPTPLGG